MRKAAAMLAGLGLLVFAQLAFGGAHQAATWDVAVGEQGKPPAGTPKGATLNQFFPSVSGSSHDFAAGDAIGHIDISGAKLR